MQAANELSALNIKAKEFVPGQPSTALYDTNGAAGWAAANGGYYEESAYHSGGYDADGMAYGSNYAANGAGYAAYTEYYGGYDYSQVDIFTIGLLKQDG